MATLLSEREQLARLVQEWNENRLDLFHLSPPTEDLEIEGVMRFYFQDNDGRIVTKCVRVSSTATALVVIDALVDKFLPDMKMLTDEKYSLWEVHECGEERRLDGEEKPLLVQLMWHRNDREGRFLLRRDRAAFPLGTIQLQQADEMERNNKRFSKREKKEPKTKVPKDIVTLNGGMEEAGSISDIYRQLPTTNFTRTISNPEVVMKKRREQKIELRLKEMSQGGSVKIYGGELVPSRPYVTLLVSLNDTADKVIAEALEKYALSYCNPHDFVLVEMWSSPSAESSWQDRVLAPNASPLAVLAEGEHGDSAYLALRKKPADYRPLSCVESAPIAHDLMRIPPEPPTMIGQAIRPAFFSQDDMLNWSRRLDLQPGVTEVGSDRLLTQLSAFNICLDGADVLSRHCVITFMDFVVTVTPSASDALLFVNEVPISRTAILNDGDLVRIGMHHVFRFVNDSQKPLAVYGPRQDSLATQAATSNQQTTLESEHYASLPQLNHSAHGLSSTGAIGGGMGASRQSAQVKEWLHQRNNAHEAKWRSGLLAVSIQIGDYKAWDFLVEVISRGWADSVAFRLSPAYSLYLALRFFHTYSKPYLVQFLTRIGHNISQIAQECVDRDELLFWLANTSELCFLVERDPNLRSPRGDQLGAVVGSVFDRLSVVVAGALRPACRPMFNTQIAIEDGCDDLLTVLDAVLRAARGCHLNAALTIQLCAHMFHAINATIFNTLVGVPEPAVVLTSSLAMFLKNRLEIVSAWSERMGVELPAECHLDRTKQALHLLTAPKNDISSLGISCYRLNSIQVRYLLSHFKPTNGEVPCDDDVLHRVVSLAERQADELSYKENLPLTREETERPAMPFLLPKDGYVAEQLDGPPDGLVQYLYALQAKGLCHSVHLADAAPAEEMPWNAFSSSMNAALPNGHDERDASHASIGPSVALSTALARSSSQSTLTSLPTTVFGDSIASKSDNVVRISLKRGGGGIGLSIVAAQGVGDRQVGIFVKKVVDGTPAALDGRLAAGDQLLSVNGHQLLGISQEEAASLMAKSGAEVHFEVKKGAAERNGLAAWLCETTPTTSGKWPQSTGAQKPNSAVVKPSAQPMNKVTQVPLHAVTSSTYHKHQAGPTRTSAFVAPTPTLPSQEAYKHQRSVSASDLYSNQIDPNASFSQRSITSTSSGFDKLPAHYRASARPTVIQPARQCQSPSSLRRGAQSPSSLNGLHRPPSVTNLFAPPRSPNPLQQQGYSSGSTHDIFRASMPSPPAAQSSPREESYRNASTLPSNYSASHSSAPPLNRPLHANHNGSLVGPSSHQAAASTHYASLPIRTNDHVPRATVAPTATTVVRSVNVTQQQQPSAYSNLPGSSNWPPSVSSSSHHAQEPAVVRAERSWQQHQQQQVAQQPEALGRPTTTFGIVTGAVPTAISQALHSAGPTKILRSVQEPIGLERQLKDLEVMSLNEVRDEIERLDSKMSLSEEEKDRYRELLNVEADKSRATRQLRVQYASNRDGMTFPVVTPAQTPQTSGRRTETLIDDVGSSSTDTSAIRENVSPSRSEKKSVQFKDDVERLDLLDSPSVVGAHEVYLDPRQRRLNQIQERQMAARATNDNLDFRDKMKKFASQLGETTPKQRLHSSSAERQIEYEQ